MPLQVPVPPSVCSLAGPPAAAYGGDRDSKERVQLFKGHVIRSMHQKDPFSKETRDMINEVRCATESGSKCMRKEKLALHTRLMDGRLLPVGFKGDAKA